MSNFAKLGKRRSQKAQLTVTVDPTMAQHVENLAEEHEMTKSAVVQAILYFDYKQRQEALMAEGYAEMARE